MEGVPDYLERVYAGVLGKLIGVYVGRPFEMWSHQQILSSLGPIRSYVHDKLNQPLVVIDDDVSGTFTFIRALEEHDCQTLTSQDVARTWLNNVIDGRTIFWWGGNGISTEHTAFQNLKRGIPAPESGSAKTNGRTLAEQIGSQIFIDGWALVAPGQPAVAAKLAETAARVSHDGVAVHAAVLWAVLEAEAFVSKDVDHLLDTGLSFIPSDSIISKLIADIRAWVPMDRAWEKTRQRIEDNYGYDKYVGICHVVPNHGIMIMALLYGGHSFHEAIYIVNTSGWDTDCNSGNIGCLLAIMHGLQGFEGGTDWRGPLADRAIISSADGGYSINNAARIAFDIANMGRKLAGDTALPMPKGGAQWHFTLPGSVQGFQVEGGAARIEQCNDEQNRPGLAIRLEGSDDQQVVEVLTQTFTPEDVLLVKRSYELMASPLIFPGQTITTLVRSDDSNKASATITIRVKAYDPSDSLITYDSQAVVLHPGECEVIEYAIPDALSNHPIQQVGVSVSCQSEEKSTIWVDHVKYDGTPCTNLKRPNPGCGDFWHRSWVNSATTFHPSATELPNSICIAQNIGEGMVSTGTRDWVGYEAIASKLTVNLGAAGVAAHVQGLNRWYAIMALPGGKVAIIKAKDEKRTELATAPCSWELDVSYEVRLSIKGGQITGRFHNVSLEAVDAEYTGGGVGILVRDGSVSVDSVDIRPVP